MFHNSRFACGLQEFPARINPVLDQDQFDALARKGHNRIPMVREVLSDLDTPLSVYLKLTDGPYTFLLESVEGGSNWGRHSIIGLPARRVFSFRAHTLSVIEDGAVVETREVDDPLAEVERLRAQYRVPHLPDLPAFTGGLVGYFGFETVGYVESRLAKWDRADELGTPDILLVLAEEVAVFDNLKGRLYLIVHADPARPHAYARAQRRLDALAHHLRRAVRRIRNRHMVRRWTSAISNPRSRKKRSRRWWNAARNTSAPATCSRSCPRNASASDSTRGRWMSIARCVP